MVWANHKGPSVLSVKNSAPNEVHSSSCLLTTAAAYSWLFYDLSPRHCFVSGLVLWTKVVGRTQQSINQSCYIPTQSSSWFFGKTFWSTLSFQICECSLRRAMLPLSMTQGKIMACWEEFGVDEVENSSNNVDMNSNRNEAGPLSCPTLLTSRRFFLIIKCHRDTR